MNGQQYTEFEAIMSRAALLSFQQKGKDWRALITAMFEELAAYDLEAVRLAVATHVRSEKFFPTLADIVKRIDGDHEDRAAIAWAYVVKAIERLGHYLSVRFPSPAYHYAIEFMGGWQKLCTTLTEAETKWRGKEFERFFEIGERVASWGHELGKVHVPPYLLGWHETHNRRGGYALPDVLDAATGKPIQGFRERVALSESGVSKTVMQLVEGMKT